MFGPPLFAWIRNFKSGKPVGIRVLEKGVFGCMIRPDIMQRVVVWHRAGLRAGTACTKTRGEVRGSGRKIRPQKGTGRARAGSNRAPNRVGGGVVFGPKPKDWSFPINAKVVSLSLRSAFSTKYLQNQLVVVDSESIALENHKTRFLASIIEEQYKGHKILLIDANPPSLAWKLASRGIDDISIMTPEDKINAYHLLDNNLVIMTERAVEHYSKTLNPETE